VSHTPGVEVILEAYEGYWRGLPHVKRLVMKGVPEGTTRLAMLKNGEADFAFSLDGPVAEEVKRSPRLSLEATRHASIFWIKFPDQWDAKSVWAATRVETFMYSKGANAYGGYPDLDARFEQQARERDPPKREALLHRIQRLTVERAMFAPLMDFRQVIGIGPKVAEHAINLMPVCGFPSWEDV
jgi:hypothetical protein